MALNGAFNFIKALKTNDGFRQNCFRCKTKGSLLLLLEDYDFKFTEGEFSDAVNASLLKCQTEDEALDVKQIEWFFHLLP